MKTTKALLITTLLVTGILAPAAPGGAPMGPPAAMLGEGNWSIGAEFGREQIDLQGCGTFGTVYVIDPLTVEAWDFIESQRIKNLEMNMIFGTVAVGICDNLDLFVRVGAADAQDEMTATGDVVDIGIPGEYSIGSLDSSFGLAWGAGTRATFCRWGPWSIGGLMQVTWFDPGDSDIMYADPVPAGPGDVPFPDARQVGEARIDFWQAQFSLAAVYQVDTLRFWAGPFLQFIEGDLKRDGRVLFLSGGEFVDFGDTFDASSDIQEQSQFGAHFGTSWEITDQWNLWVEGQVTGDSWLIGIGTFFATEETFGM
jgi:hypothetical protein